MNYRRFRDRRVDEETRKRYRENEVSSGDLIWPLFVREGEGIREPIASMPEVYRYSLDRLVEAVGALVPAGLKSVLLFGIPGTKGPLAAADPEGLVPRAVRVLKGSFPGLEVITDVCLCSYTHDGQCHIGDNDETCRLLARVALAHAGAGADVVAPSDMMDGRVFHIRKALDGGGFSQVPILSYAAKYASAWYGPFRDAAECAPRNGDRAGYQMDPPNALEAMEEIAADLEEGARAVIIKPGLSYLDIVRRARERFPGLEISVYNVSGEYTMIHQMIASGLAPERMVDELLVSFKRAGADRIITYFVPRVLERYP